MNKVWNKIIAAICVLALFVTSVQILPASVADAAGKDVTSITLLADNDVVWYDDDGGMTFDELQSEGYIDTYNGYEFEINSEDNSIKIMGKGAGVGFTGSTYTIYAKIKGENPEVQATYNDGTSVKSINGCISSSTAIEGKYQIDIPLLRNVKGDITVSLIPRYKVKYPVDTDDFEILDEAGNSISSREALVKSGEAVKFKVQLTNPDATSPVIKNGKNVIESTEENGGVYTYTIQEINANADISVNAVPKKFDVNLNVQNDDGNPVVDAFSPSSTDNKVGYGDSYYFYTIPTEGYDNPTATLDEASTSNAKLNCVSENYWLLSNVTGDVTVNINAARKTVKVTATAGTGYTIQDSEGNPIDVATPYYGDVYSFKVVPDEGYDVKVYVNGKQVNGTENCYTTEALTEDAAITVQAAVKKCTITPPDESDAYMFSMNGTKTVDYGSDITFNVVPKDGYKNPKAVYVIPADQENINENDKPITGYNGVYTYSNVKQDMKIVVEQGDSLTYQVNLQDGDGYVFSDIKVNDIDNNDGNVFDVSYNAKVTFNVKPSEGYNVKQVLKDGVVIMPDESGVYTLNNITANTSVSVKTSKQSYSVNIANPSVDGYTIYMGASTVEYGSRYEFDVIPNDGYEFAKVTYEMDGKTVELSPTGNGSYVIPSVKGDVTINITASGMKQQTITFVGDNCSFASENGNNLGNTDSVDYGTENYTFKLVVNSGYSLKDTATVSINGVGYEAEADKVYSISKITGDVTVSVTGIVKNSTVSIKDAKDDSSKHWESKMIGYNEKDGVPYGGSVTFEITPDRGYKVVSVVRGGTELKAVNGTYTVTDIKSDTNISVETAECDAVVVNYVDSRYGNSEEKSYSIPEMTELASGEYGTKVKEVKNKKAFTFAGWYDDKDNKVEYIKEDMSGKEITLTAKWTLTKDVLVKLNTKGTVSEVQGKTTYRVTFSTLSEFVDDLADSDKEGISITGYGTLYGPDKRSKLTDDEIKKFITERDMSLTNVLMKGEPDPRLLNYYANCNLKTDDFNGKEFAIAVTAASEEKANNRYAAGWIELNVYGETVTVVADFAKSSAVAEAVAEMID